jgi:hypothetical protein
MPSDMTSPSTLDPTLRKAKRLSAAVWILAILLSLTLFVSFVLIRSVSVTRSEFDRLSPEERVHAASVIALAKYQRSGSTLRCVISEIVKQTPGTKFYYKVGDEFRAGNQRATENTDFGDGEILFFTGSPARLELITAYRADRITGLGDMPISLLREIIRTSK